MLNCSPRQLLIWPAKPKILFIQFFSFIKTYFVCVKTYKVQAVKHSKKFLARLEALDVHLCSNVTLLWGYPKLTDQSEQMRDDPVLVHRHTVPRILAQLEVNHFYSTYDKKLDSFASRKAYISTALKRSSFFGQVVRYDW